jgi:hypothetical protein
MLSRRDFGEFAEYAEYAEKRRRSGHHVTPASPQPRDTWSERTSAQSLEQPRLRDLGGLRVKVFRQPG